MIKVSDQLTIDAIPVWSGWRMMLVETRYSGRSQSWEQDYEPIDDKVYETKLECYEAIKTRFASGAPKPTMFHILAQVLRENKDAV